MAIGILLPIAVAVSLAARAGDPAPDPRALEARRALEAGDFERANSIHSQLAATYAISGNRSGELAALHALAEGELALGDTRAAERSAVSALEMAHEQGDERAALGLLILLGRLQSVSGRHEAAEAALREAAESAHAAQWPHLEAVALINLGNAQLSRGETGAALARYVEAGEAARRSDDPMLVDQTLSNRARASLESGNPSAAKALLEEAAERVAIREASHRKAALLLHLAVTSRKLQTVASDPEASASLLRRCHALLIQAAEVANAVGDGRSESYALGYLGGVYEDRGRLDEALDLTRRALFLAETRPTPEIAWRWYQQLGRLHRALGEQGAAIEDYRAAAARLDALRYRIAASQGAGEDEQRGAADRVHRELVDLLLLRAASQSEPSARLADLHEARETTERVKAGELRDYFGDECVDAHRAKARSLDEIARTEAVLYPILLPDRIETLVTLPGGEMKSYRAEVDRITFENEVRHLRALLVKRTTREFMRPARQLYTWMIAPIIADLEASESRTLVFVPAGAL
ncbi:MAG: hypothetical protein JRG92_20980, partial [Deltaproteobacteria bacterium]|nr:hypothetical protein [Deltaproteobacteria bacterium]